MDVVVSDVRELMGPGGTMRGVGSVAIAMVFRIIGSLLIAGLAPVVPAFRMYMAAHLTADKHRLAVWAPGAREPDAAVLHIRCGRQLTVIEHVAILAVLRCGRCRQIPSPKAVEFAAVEHCCRLAEDEINGSFDVAILIIFALVLTEGVKRVLKAEEPTTTEHRTVCPDMTGYGLAYGTR